MTVSAANSNLKLPEPISKMWIRVQGKAQTDSKAEHGRKYSSILDRFVTQPWTLRRIFEMGSN
jgi:hypothetical protein